MSNWTYILIVFGWTVYIYISNFLGYVHWITCKIIFQSEFSKQLFNFLNCLQKLCLKDEVMFCSWTSTDRRVESWFSISYFPSWGKVKMAIFLEWTNKSGYIFYVWWTLEKLKCECKFGVLPKYEIRSQTYRAKDLRQWVNKKNSNLVIPLIAIDSTKINNSTFVLVVLLIIRTYVLQQDQIQNKDKHFLGFHHFYVCKRKTISSPEPAFPIPSGGKREALGRDHWSEK